jgi:alkyl sulfatase BDS1-like metallo-beta-lactamase superfamily hydrolase
MPTKIIMLFTLTFVLLTGCKQPNDKHVNNKQQLNNTPKELEQHSATFDKGVVKVTDNVYVAIGYGLANSIMIEGKTGLIIVDTMESKQEAKIVLDEFRKISNKPVKAIIYTHNHADHVFGAATFAEAGDNVEIYGHESTQHYINRVVNTLRPTIATRSMRMFGSHLDQHELVNAGIGPFLGVDKDSILHSMTPTKTFKNQLSVTIDGIDIQLVHAPGETEDQLFVWLPKQKVLMPGDNLYKSFPNLYTIRGTYYRDVTKWISSLDKMRRFEPEYVIPSHTRPIIGKVKISEILTVYRDAIQFVHDQTIRYMNQGLTIENVVKAVQLPQHLASHLYLQEFYGTVEWSVKSIFTGYMGWFDGNSTTLQPLPELTRNKKMAKLAGGVDKLFQQLEQAMTEKEYQWGLMVADMLVGTDLEDNAKLIKAKILRKMAELESNPNARHYYFTQAKELENKDFKPAIFVKPQPEFLEQLPVASLFAAMPASLIAEDTLDVVLTVEFWITDIEQTFTIQIRNGIAEVQNYSLGTPDVKIETSSQVWKEIASKIRNPVSAIISGDLSVSTGKLKLIEFLGYFDLPDLE